MLKGSFEPQRSQVHLQATPDPEELYYFLLDLAQNRGKYIDVTWLRPDGLAKFKLTLSAIRSQELIRWQLFSGNPPNEKLLWDNTTKDVVFIHNLIVKSCGSIKITQNNIPKSSSSNTKLPASNTNLLLAAELNTNAEEDNSIVTGISSFISLTDLIDNIAKARNTGKLTVFDLEHEYQVFFEDGKLTHCSSDYGSGVGVFIDLLETEDNRFQFEASLLPPNRTINQDMEEILNLSQLVGREARYLKDIGVSVDSLISQVNVQLLEIEFESTLSEIPIEEITHYKVFYRLIDGKSSIKDLVKLLKLDRGQWIPIVSALFKHGLVSLPSCSDGVEKHRKLKKIKPLDQSLIQSVRIILKRADTGILTYPALLFFLEQEYLRSQRLDCPFSLMIITLLVKGLAPGVEATYIKSTAAAEFIKRIEIIRRRTDYFSHYETNDYALLLPNTLHQGAKILANRFINKLLIHPLSPTVNSQNLIIATGIVCAPADVQDLHWLLPAAEEARDFALKHGSRIISYQDLPV